MYTFCILGCRGMQYFCESEVAFVYFMFCFFVFVMHRVFFLRTIVSCVGGCIFLLLFFGLLLSMGVCAFKWLLRVLLQTIVCRKFWLRFHPPCFVAASRAVKLVYVSDFFKPSPPPPPLLNVPFLHETMSICCQIRDSTSFICQRAVCICMLSPSTRALCIPSNSE